MEPESRSGVFPRMTDMMIIREYANEMEAIVAQNVLEANNIPSAILRDNAGGMLPVLQVIYPVRIAVSPSDADLALSLLDEDTAVEGDIEADIEAVPAAIDTTTGDGSTSEAVQSEPGEAPAHTTDKVAGSE